MKKVLYLNLFLSIIFSVNLHGQDIYSQYRKEKTDIKPNALYNLEEIKVRWKKAALENCSGTSCVTISASACGQVTSVSDIDGNSYNTVSVGNQCWTKENLKVTKYNDGTAIPLDTSPVSSGPSSIWGGLSAGAYSIMDNESNTGPNAANYGFLYNWYAAAGIVIAMGSPSKNICPAGWHVPSDGEWTILIKFIDHTANATALGPQSPTAGGKLKAINTLWTSPNIDANNFSGFSALPGGYRNNNGSFLNGGRDAFFWGTTEINASSNAWARTMYFNLGVVYRDIVNKSIGSSVRCLMD
jgi:uncharacterized protein (TIGR02145 family)